MSDIRVIVGKVPHLLGEIITAALVREKGIRVVGEAESEDDLVDLCARAKPDLVVLGSNHTDAEDVGRRLLQRSPGVKIVALVDNGRNTFVYELRPYKVEVGQLSAKELVQVVTRLFDKDLPSTA